MSKQNYAILISVEQDKMRKRQEPYTQKEGFPLNLWISFYFFLHIFVLFKLVSLVGTLCEQSLKNLKYKLESRINNSLSNI